MQWVLDWFSNNWSEIVVFLTSSTFVTSLVAFVNLLRSGKSTNENTKSNKSVLDALSVVNNTKESIDAVEKDSKTLMTRVENLEVVVDKNNKRLDAMLDMFVTVFSRSKDEDVRNQVSLISNSVKYADTVYLNELRDEVRDLREQLSQKNNETEKTEETEEVVENSVGIEVTEEILRG